MQVIQRFLLELTPSLGLLGPRNSIDILTENLTLLKQRLAFKMPPLQPHLTGFELDG